MEEKTILTLSDICNEEWFEGFTAVGDFQGLASAYLHNHDVELAMEILVNYNFPIHEQFKDIAPALTRKLFYAHYNKTILRLLEILDDNPGYDVTSNTYWKENRKWDGTDTTHRTGYDSSQSQTNYTQNYSTTYDNVSGGQGKPAGFPTTGTEVNGGGKIQYNSGGSVDYGKTIDIEKQGSNGGEPIQNLLKHEVDFRTNYILLELICKMCVNTFCNGVIESEGFYGGNGRLLEM